MIANLLITIAQWRFPDGPWRWAKPEEPTKPTNRAGKRAKKSAPSKEEMVTYELHMGANVLRDPRGAFRNLSASGIIFRDMKPVNISPEQGEMFVDAVAMIPDMQKTIITMASMLEVASRLLAQVDTSPGKDWNEEMNALRAQIKTFNEPTTPAGEPQLVS